jgi:hypothetical protein
LFPGKDTHTLTAFENRVPNKLRGKLRLYGSRWPLASLSQQMVVGTEARSADRDPVA